MDSIPLKLRPLVRRLESLHESNDISRQELVSILFVIRLGDCLHRAFYGTFLTTSLVEELCQHLRIPDLTLEMEVYATRWNFRQGLVVVAHSIQWDYDMETVAVLSKIGRSVLAQRMTPKEALRFMSDHEKQISTKRLESCYRDFPTRGLVIPLMACTCASVFFEGTWLDVGFAAICGLACGLVAWGASVNDQFQSISDYLAAIVTAMIALGSVQAFEDSTCFSAQVLGTLYWFLYGTAYVMAIYEITNNQLMTGIARLAAAVLRSYGLAFGVVLGLWFCAWDTDKWNVIAAECSTKNHQISDLWFILLFPLAGIACLMQFRVRLGHFCICLVVQTIAYGSQYLIGTVWKQPDFFANLVPAFLATIASHLCIVLASKLKISSLFLDKDAYFVAKKKTDNDEEQEREANDDDNDGEEGTVQLNSNGDETITTQHYNGELQLPPDYDNLQTRTSSSSDNTIGYLNTGWAEQNDTTGYTRADKLAHARSDLWFCLLPALYLLVPGSKLLQSAFTDLLSGLEGAEANEENLSTLTSLSSSLIVIGLGQVVGLRIGFTTLWAWHRFWAYWSCSSRDEGKMPGK